MNLLLKRISHASELTQLSDISAKHDDSVAITLNGGRRVASSSFTTGRVDV